MELICPECRSILNVQGRVARCQAHGAEYEVMFDRDAESLRRTSGSQAATATNAVCTNHPRTPAAYTCPKCARPICTMCAFDVGGKQYCPDCATHAASGASGEPELTPAPPPPPAPIDQPVVNNAGLLTLNLTAALPAAQAAIPPDLECVQHPHVAAASRCRVCSNGMCPVCDFALPNGMHVCPACIENRSTETITPERTYRAWGGIALAVFATLFFGLVAGGMVLTGEDRVTAIIIDVIVLLLNVAGVWLSFSAVEPALGNTPVIWTAAIWNTVLLAVFVLFSIIGTFTT